MKILNDSKGEINGNVNVEFVDAVIIAAALENMHKHWTDRSNFSSFDQIRVLQFQEEAIHIDQLKSSFHNISKRLNPEL